MLIRKLQKSDIARVADIWLDTNLKAHDFISAKYWKDHFEFVKGMLSQTEVYVYESNRKIQGFIGINGEHIEGVFCFQRNAVAGDRQSTVEGFKR